MLPPTYATVLRPGEHLSDRAVSSPNGEFSLVHQHDGNVVIYRNADGHAVWATGTNFQGDVDLGARTGRLTLRENGSLAVQDSDGIYLWQSPAQPNPAQLSLVVTDRGQALLVDGSGREVWYSPRPPEYWRVWKSVSDGHRLRRGQTLRGQSLTSANGRFTLVWDHGGQVYLREKDVGVRWLRRLEPGAGLVMDDEGSLDVRHPNGTVSSWTLAPSWQGVHECYVSDEGRITLADGSGQVLWAGEAPQGMLRDAEWPADIPERRLRSSERPEIDLSDHNEFDALVVRTDFEHPEAWARIVAELHLPMQGVPDSEPATPRLIDDPIWAGAHYEEIVSALPADAPEAVFVADSEAMSTDDRGLLAVHAERLLNPEEFAEDFDPDEVPEAFRIEARQAELMTVNLALANSDFEDWVHQGIDLSA
ncbi:DUF6924 domain-containing protein [Kineosporia babensis]|uniref:Bulb-type lectin domain-containing protein n=1 Tax=Kineosporia babensis TaxID=499548 RepID=A0A9X1SXV5_9ACTN|nr:hypothetical protein [Kineosporia babensis]MCD5310513.1 hypothetical protein [Kineosporia babensis]